MFYITVSCEISNFLKNPEKYFIIGKDIENIENFRYSLLSDKKISFTILVNT